MPSRFKFIATFFVIVTWVLTALSPIGVTPAYAASLVVNTAADTNDGACNATNCTLREAIITANSQAGADSITFAGDYIITLASALPQLIDDLTIDGSGHSVTVSGNHAVGVFDIQSGVVVTMSRLSIIDGATATGGGIFNRGRLTVSHSTFSGNSTSGVGGGISNVGTLMVSYSTFSGNSAQAGGGLYNSAGTLTVSNSTFSGNSATTLGGGLRGNTGAMTVTHSTLSGNSAGNGGGGVANVSGPLYLRNSLIANNSLSGGECLNQGTFTANVNNLIEDGSCSPALSGDPLLGPLGNYGGSTQSFALLPGSPAIDAAGDCTPYLNPDEDQRGVARPQSSACDIGAYEAKEQIGPDFVVNLGDDSDDGACDLFGVGTLDCTLREAINAANSQAGANTITFAGNYTITLGGRLPNVTTEMSIIGNGASNTIVQASASPNTAAYRVFTVDTTGNLTLNGLTVQNGCNSGCLSGGGVYNGGAMTISSVVFKANYATYGGGLHNSSSNLTLTNVTFSGNWGPNGGGMNNFNSSPTLTNVTFSGNSASNGGGLRNEAGSNPTLANVTFSGNAAADRGGGIFNDASNPTLVNVTLSGNSAASNGGGLYNFSSSHPILKNTIIANSVSGGDCVNSPSSSVDATSINNLIEDSANACGLTDGTNGNIVGQDPKLDALANNGGSTQTFALLPGSPAIDAGNDATCAASPVNNLDQRGIARPQGAHCDIGTFESRGFTLTKIGGDNQSTLIQTAFPTPLVISVTSAAGEPVNGGQVIVSAPVSGASLTTTPITLTIANGAVSSTVTANGIAGAYNVIASARGAANAAFNLTNELAGTTTSLTSTPNPSTFGQAITFTATVTTSAVGLGTPIGSITFTIDSLSLNVPLDANGQAVYVTTTLSVGHHPITATYSGDANHTGSTSNTVDQVVNQADTAATLTSALNPSIVGQAVTFTATVASTVDTPSGSVQFYVDGAALGSPLALSNGQASLSTLALAVGTHPITATYSGDVNYHGGVSNQVDQVVNHAKVYLPLISHNFVNAPDLIVQSLTANANTVQVVIKNQGTAPVVDEFWVDVYVNPISAPIGVNQTWQMLGHQGLVWGVTTDALPALTPGGVLTLTVNDAHFFADLSAVAWPLAAGTQLYAQVDTADTATTYGAVLETHEVRGEPYNNILGPVLSSTLALTSTPRRAQLSSATLPLRPH
jgi:CSLREA domain-containing protein